MTTESEAASTKVVVSPNGNSMRSSLVGGQSDLSSDPVINVNYSANLSLDDRQDSLPIANISTYSLDLPPPQKLNSKHDLLDHLMHFGGKESHFTAHKISHTRKTSLVESLKGEIFEKSPMHSVIFNMLAGMGTVGLPYTYKSSGLIGGITIMIFTAYISAYTLRLLISVGNRVQVEDYEQLVKFCFGNTGYWILNIALIIFDLGACISYNIILGDSAHDVVNKLFDWDYKYDREIILIIASVFVILPFCLGRNFRFIEKISGGAVLTVWIITGVVVFKMITKCSHNNFNSWEFGVENSSVELFKISGIIPALGTVSFAFVIHDSSFLIYKTLENGTTRRFGIMSCLALTLMCTVCSIICIAGYLTFGNKTDPDILKNYHVNDLIVTITRCIYTGTMALTYPTAFYVVRHIIHGSYYKLKGEENHCVFEFAPRKEYIIFTFSPWLFCLCVALFVSNLGIVMSIAGLLSATIIAFILPPACYLKICGYNWMIWKHNSGERMEAFKHTIFKVFLIIYGLFCCIIGTIYTLVQFYV